MINIVIPIEPKPAPRPRMDKTSGRVYMPEWYKIYKSAIQFYVRKQAPAYLSADPLFIEMSFQKPCEVTSARYGDIDNLVKGVLDALNGLMWKDDRQVVGTYARKFNTGINEIELRIDYQSLIIADNMV